MSTSLIPVLSKLLNGHSRSIIHRLGPRFPSSKPGHPDGRELVSRCDEEFL